MIKKVKNHYEITLTNPACRLFFFWRLPEKVRTYVGSGTVWYCRETRKRATTAQEERFSTMVAFQEMNE